MKGLSNLETGLYILCIGFGILTLIWLGVLLKIHWMRHRARKNGYAGIEPFRFRRMDNVFRLDFRIKRTNGDTEDHTAYSFDRREWFDKDSHNLENPVLEADLFLALKQIEKLPRDTTSST